jgi:hypothetical protein
MTETSRGQHRHQEYRLSAEAKGTIGSGTRFIRFSLKKYNHVAKCHWRVLCRRSINSKDRREM